MAVPPETRIVSILTVPPYKPTNPKFSRHVFVKDCHGWEAIQACINIVLYYSKGQTHDSGSKNVAWIKDSLGMAFLDTPLLGGRLRRDEGELKIVSNDCGARLIEGTLDASLQEFISMKEKDELLEAQLVFWNELEEHSFQLSALFCVQVTVFSCGGHSIGISVSALMADYIMSGGFIQRWARIHKALGCGSDAQSIFYPPNLSTTAISPHTCFRSRPAEIYTSTVVCKASGDGAKDVELPALCLLSVEEAERKLDRVLPNQFPLLTIESPEVTKVENCKKGKSMDMPLTMELATASLEEELGMENVAFIAGEEPVSVSYWIRSATGASVVALSSSSEGNASEFTILVNVGH